MDWTQIRNIANPGLQMTSSVNTCRLGEHGIYDGCIICPREDACEGVKDASKAPLCHLSPYIASRHREVRFTAKARFAELRDGPPPKQLLKDRLKSTPRFLRNLPTTSRKI